MVATETGTFVLLLSRLNCFLLTAWEMKANWSVGKRTWEFPLVVLLRSENSATASLSFWFHSLLSTLSLKWGKISISFDKNDQNIQLFVVASLKKKKKCCMCNQTCQSTLLNGLSHAPERWALLKIGSYLELPSRNHIIQLYFVLHNTESLSQDSEDLRHEQRWKKLSYNLHFI